MTAIAIVVLAGTDTRADLGRVVNALQTVRELNETGDDVALIFDGAGTLWIPKLSEPTHKYHDLFERTRPAIAGACSYCAKAFGAEEGIETTGVPLLDEFDGHPSLRKLISNGYQVITF